MNKPWKQQPDMQRLLARLPAETVRSFSNDQLYQLDQALSQQRWRKHPVDIRGRLSLPFIPSRLYFVLLMGRDHRELSRREREVGFVAVLSLVAAFFALSTLMGILALYLVKSALGINLFSDFSLGIWQWFSD